MNTIDLVWSGGPAEGTMDVKMLPKDPLGYRIHRRDVRRTYLPNQSIRGTAVAAFDLAHHYPARELPPSSVEWGRSWRLRNAGIA